MILLFTYIASSTRFGRSCRSLHWFFSRISFRTSSEERRRLVLGFSYVGYYFIIMRDYSMIMRYNNEAMRTKFVWVRKLCLWYESYAWSMITGMNTILNEDCVEFSRSMNKLLHDSIFRIKVGFGIITAQRKTGVLRKIYRLI